MALDKKKKSPKLTKPVPNTTILRPFMRKVFGKDQGPYEGQKGIHEGDVYEKLKPSIDKPNNDKQNNRNGPNEISPHNSVNDRRPKDDPQNANH
jgi:hypothetical protein